MIGALLVLALAAAPFVSAGSTGSTAVVAADTGKAVNSDVVDLNHATVMELCTLPGIGPKKADAIIALRGKRAFTRVSQLLQVKGIGPKTLDRLKARLRITPATATGTTGATGVGPSLSAAGASLAPAALPAGEGG